MIKMISEWIYDSFFRFISNSIIFIFVSTYMFPDIYLDTNVIQWIRFDDIKALEYYLIKTKRKAYTSKVVIEELKHNYRDNAEKFLLNLKQSLKEVSRFDVSNVIKLEDFNDEKFIEDYVNSKMSQSSFVKFWSVSTKVIDLAIQRLATKRPPCHWKEEIKDAIIWFDYLSTRQEKNHDMYFLSHNIKDFLRKDWVLCSELMQDLLDRGFSDQCVIEPSWSLIWSFLKKFEYEDLPVIDHDILKEKVISIEKAKSFLKLNKRSDQEWYFITDNCNRFELLAIQKTKGPKLKYVYDINLISKDWNSYVFTFKMLFSYTIRLLYSEYEIQIDKDIIESLEWRFVYNIDNKEFILLEESINIEYETIDSDAIAFNIVSEIEKQIY